MPESKTIVAPASALAPSGIAIVRISGNETSKILKKIFISKISPIDNERMCVFGNFINPETKEILDEGLAVFFKGPKSYTGEDVAELNLHGNPLIVKNVLKALYVAGAEPAEAGEFTKRAFLNGKLDLVQAEAVNDVILSGAEESLKLSQENLDGRFSKAIEKLGEPLRNILSELEAHIDFPEEDITPNSLEAIKEKLLDAKKILKTYIDSFDYGQSLKEGFRVLIFGVPNSGKSSLLNKLLVKERAIVTDISGTTRDLIEEKATINGIEFIFCDSAGIRDTNNAVEKIGVDLAKEKINWANLILFLTDSLNEIESEKLYKFLKEQNKNFWIIQNKIDLNDKEISFIKDDIVLKISALKDIGIKELRVALEDFVKSKNHFQESSVIVTNQRHLLCLEKSFSSLSSSIDAIVNSLPLEIISAELKLSLNALEEIIGKTYNEDILGRIFSKFCIGK